MAARHVELLAVAQKLAFCEYWNELYGLIGLVNSSPEGLMENLGDYLTWNEYVTR